jgi:hypothetical protein
VYDVGSLYATHVNYNNLYNSYCYSGYTTQGGSFNSDMEGYAAGLLATPVPEPTVSALAGLGLTGWLVLRRRR